jgi:hypothetical protein
MTSRVQAYVVHSKFEEIRAMMFEFRHVRHKNSQRCCGDKRLPDVAMGQSCGTAPEYWNLLRSAPRDVIVL